MRAAFNSVLNRTIQFIKSRNNSTVQDFLYWREFIYNSTIFFAMIVGLIAFTPTVYFSVLNDQRGVIIAYVAGYSWLCLSFFIKAIPFKVKAFITAYVFYVVGVLMLLSDDYYHTGLIWLFIFPILLSLIFNIRITALGIASNALAFLVLGFFFRYHPHSLPDKGWLDIVNAINFIVINAMTAFSISILLHGFSDALNKERAARNDFINEREKLSTVNISLQKEIAERRIIEENLKEGEARYRSVFENTGTATFLVDKELVIDMMNSEAERLCGFSSDEIARHKSFADFVAEYDRDRILSYHEMRKQGQLAPEKYEFDFMDRGHETKAVLARVSVMPGSETRIISLLDVTHIKQTSETLKSKEELLTLALETTSDGIWDWFIETGQAFFSSRYYTMLGFEPDELPQNIDTWKNLIHPDDRNAVFENIENQLKGGGEAFIVEFRARTKNGDWKWITEKGTVVERNGQGKPVRIIGTHVDVTDQKQILDSLLNSEKKYRTLYNNALVGMFSFRKSDARAVSINDFGCRMLGYGKPEDVIGIDILSKHYLNETQRSEMARQLLSEGEIYSNEIEIVRRDGSSSWVSLSMKLYENQDQIDCFFVDITRRKKAEDQLHNLMFYDQLTRLPNKEMFMNRLIIEIVRAHRRGQVFSVISLGLDNFKKINDMHGTKVGDKVLTEVGIILNETLRKDDLIARISGDHFMILLSDIGSTDDVMEIVKKIKESLTEPFAISNTIIKLTASMGVALYPLDGDSGEKLIKNSESAMFMAKETGKNSYIMFDQKMHDQTLKYFEIEEELRRAIEKDEFLAYYQPKVDQSGQLIGMETLIRWNSSRYGFVPPGEFIGIAERSGMIAEIGDIILRKACGQNKAWQERGFRPLKVAVNLSPYQFRSSELIRNIRLALDGSGLESQWLDLEITESGIMENENECIKRLNELHAMGISISIDDFGTGYSSLSKLKLYPIDTLKIDKSFVDDLPDDPHSVSITTSIIDLAFNLGFSVTAEGVENKKQLDFLVSKECGSFQGYYFYKPMPAEEFEKLLTK